MSGMKKGENPVLHKLMRKVSEFGIERTFSRKHSFGSMTYREEGKTDSQMMHTRKKSIMDHVFNYEREKQYNE
jgi:hypothetical protein